MQTFLPYPDFAQSAKSLDRARLGKQRIEAKQILLALTNPLYGWQNHPAVKMWKGYEHSLCLYGAAICKEWISRGYIDNQLPWFTAKLSEFGPKTPDWMGFEAFHLSHRSNLVRKLPAHYAPIWPGVPDNLEYVWPVK